MTFVAYIVCRSIILGLGLHILFCCFILLVSVVCLYNIVYDVSNHSRLQPPVFKEHIHPCRPPVVKGHTVFIPADHLLSRDLFIPPRFFFHSNNSVTKETVSEQVVSPPNEKLAFYSNMINTHCTVCGGHRSKLLCKFIEI